MLCNTITRKVIYSLFSYTSLIIVIPPPYLLGYSKPHLYRTKWHHLIWLKETAHKPLRSTCYLPQIFTNEIILTLNSNALHRNITIIKKVDEDPFPVYCITESVFLTTRSVFPVQDLLTPTNSISSSLSEAGDSLLRMLSELWDSII